MRTPGMRAARPVRLRAVANESSSSRVTTCVRCGFWTSPIIDVQNTQRTQVVTRELLDSLATARNLTGLAALIPGVRIPNTDGGGNRQVGQGYMRSDCSAPT